MVLGAKDKFCINDEVKGKSKSLKIGIQILCEQYCIGKSPKCQYYKNFKEKFLQKKNEDEDSVKA